MCNECWYIFRLSCWLLHGWYESYDYECFLYSSYTIVACLYDIIVLTMLLSTHKFLVTLKKVYLNFSSFYALIYQINDLILRIIFLDFGIQFHYLSNEYLNFKFVNLFIFLFSSKKMRFLIFIFIFTLVCIWVILGLCF